MKTITLTDVKVENISWHPDLEMMEVQFSVVDATGYAYQTGRAFFFKTLPPSGEPNIWGQGNVYQLPAAYANAFATLSADIHTALVARLLQ